MALVEGCKHALEITVPVAEIEKETEAAVASIAAKVRLPGFRPGKAPANLVRSRFAGDIRQEVLEKLVPRFLQEAVQREHLEVVSQPEISDVHFHPGEPLKFKAEFEVAPVFDLGEYRGLTVYYTQPEVSEEDIQQRLEQIREQKAEYVNEEPRPLADGDFAVVSLQSLEGVAEPVAQDDLMLKIGDEATLREFSDNLRGASPDESRDFEVTYPDDYDRKNLAGRTVKFRAVVKHVRRKELPELNDEFAKDLGDYQTLEELKEAIRKSILADREHHAQDDAKNQLLDRLVETHDFPVPEAYVDRQIKINVENQLRQFVAQGIDPRGLKLDWEKVKESQKDRAARDVKASLLVDKVADREAISPTQEEVDREVNRIARQQKKAVAVVRAEMQKDGTLNRIAGHIRTEKTLSFLFDQARKEAPPAKEPEQEQASENNG